VRFRLGTIRQ